MNLDLSAVTGAFWFVAILVAAAFIGNLAGAGLVTRSWGEPPMCFHAKWHEGHGQWSSSSRILPLFSVLIRQRLSLIFFPPWLS